jgi:heterotetrameric sarcosine oxidase gamma subunit
VSAGESRSIRGEDAGVRLANCAVDILELAAFRGQAAALAALAAQHGAPLPTFGHVASGTAGIILAVRPGRWLLLAPPAEPGALSRFWQDSCGQCAAVIELSAALAAFHLRGEATRELLKRGCRLDLDPARFPAGSAASTIMAQVPVTLAALANGVLLLAPSSTSRHFREWLTATAKPFGLGALANASVALLSGESMS